MVCSIGEYKKFKRCLTKITVRLHTILQRKTSEGLIDYLEIDLKPASKLSDLLDELEVDMDIDSMLLVVNGRMADPSQKLRDGDQVNLMPAISGGWFISVG